MRLELSGGNDRFGDLVQGHAFDFGVERIDKLDKGHDHLASTRW